MAEEGRIAAAAVVELAVASAFAAVVLANPAADLEEARTALVDLVAGVEEVRIYSAASEAEVVGNHLVAAAAYEEEASFLLAVREEVVQADTFPDPVVAVEGEAASSAEVVSSSLLAASAVAAAAGVAFPSLSEAEVRPEQAFCLRLLKAVVEVLLHLVDLAEVQGIRQVLHRQLVKVHLAGSGRARRSELQVDEYQLLILFVSAH